MHVVGYLVQQEGSDDVISASAVAGVAQTSGERKVDQRNSATGSAVHPKEVVLASSSS